MQKNITIQDYQALSEFRRRIRQFLRFSEQAAQEAGLEPKQHRLLLTIKGLPSGVRPRIAELAQRLQIQHHSAVELVNRLETRGFVSRKRGEQDRREVLLHLTAKGEKVLCELSLHHRAELRSQGPELLESLRVLIGEKSITRIKKGKSGE